MNRKAPLFLSVCLLLAAAPLGAKENQLPFQTIVIKHFVNGNASSLPSVFADYFCDGLRDWLAKNKAANQVVEEGVTVAGADAANSLVVEGKFTSYQKGTLFTLGKVEVEFSVYRASDHALVKTFSATGAFKGADNDKTAAQFSAMRIGYALREAIRDVNLASIPPAALAAAPPVAAPPAASAPGSTEAAATVQFSSDPSGAEITIDGDYAGSTPSTIKLKPGTHSIKMTHKGYLPWVRSIEVAAGESRNIAAELDAARP